MHAHRIATLAPLLLLVACKETSPIVERDTPTDVTVVLDARTKLGGVALGDVYPELPGLEIVAVAVDGRVFVVRNERGRWRNEIAFQAPGELIQVACGDLLPDHPGDEILAVGMAEGDEDSGGPGAAWMAARERGRGFVAVELLRPSALQHAAVVGDFVPSHPGLEGISAGFDRTVHLFLVDDDLSFEHREVAELDGPGKGACLQGDDAVVACADGKLVRVRRDDGGDFDTEVLASGPAGFARPASSGDDLLVACDDGALLWLRADGVSEVAYRSEAKLRGAFLGDLDAAHPGVEAATAGYDGRIVLVRRSGTGFASVDLATADSAFHHLVGGDVLPDRPGPELVVVGYSGEIRVLSR
ncbi:MAG: hypothetical protein R3F34_10450 [Planctomycetota bacterium]